MDLIVCRNVLMYFAPSQTRNVIGKLRNALIDRGWLAVSLSEASQAMVARLLPVDADTPQ
jgi:chemotaxis protein methyltransferase CheR